MSSLRTNSHEHLLPLKKRLTGYQKYVRAAKIKKRSHGLTGRETRRAIQTREYGSWFGQMMRTVYGPKASTSLDIGQAITTILGGRRGGKTDGQRKR